MFISPGRVGQFTAPQNLPPTSTAFTPASLSPAVWYDPSDLSSMRVGTAGKGGSPNVGDPVGLIIDKSQGGLNGLGSELVTNGTFDSDVSGWSAFGDAATTLTWSAGVMEINAATTFDGALQNITTEDGATHLVSATITVGTAASARLGFAGVNSDSVTSGTAEIIVAADALGETLTVITGASTGTFTVDDVSVRKIPGNHATASSDSARPVYRASPNRLDHDAVDDQLIVRGLPDLGSSATVATLVSGSWVYLEGQTIGAGDYNLPNSDWSECIILDRELTAQEKSDLDGYAA